MQVPVCFILEIHECVLLHFGPVANFYTISNFRKLIPGQLIGYAATNYPNRIVIC